MTITCPRCLGKGTIDPSFIQLLRQRARLSQVQVAEKLGIQQPAYARLEARASGLRRWSKHVRELAAFYKVTVEQLLEGPLPAPAGTRRVAGKAIKRQGGQGRAGVGKKPRARS